MSVRPFVAPVLKIVALGAGIASLAFLVPVTPTPTPDPIAVAPYCMVDREVPEHLTVAGPSGGKITVDGERSGELVLVDAIDYGAEVAPDAGPFDGILYNVDGPGEVRVDGMVCETT